MLPADTKILCGDNPTDIKNVREEDLILSSIGWGEIGKAKVKDVFFNSVPSTPLLKLTTAKGAVLHCTPDQLCFGRFNPSLRMYSLYLHERSTLGFRVGLTSNIIQEAISMMVLDPNSSKKHCVTDKIWVIENSPNLTNATFMHKLVMAKYGLPDIPFSSKHKDSVLPDQHIAYIFDAVDTPVGAKELLKDSNMFIDSPHMTVKLSDIENSGSDSIQFIIFGGKEKCSGGHYTHMIQIQGIQDPTNAEQFKLARKQRTNHGLWYLEITREDLEEAELFVKTVSNLDNLEVIKKIQLTKKSAYYVLPASHLKRGMVVPIMSRHGTIEEDVVNKIETYDYEGPLYDIQVKELHNFIIGQWVVMCYVGRSREGWKRV